MADDQAIAARMATAREDAKLLRERAVAAVAANPFHKGKDINKVPTNCYDQDGKHQLPLGAAKNKAYVKISKTRAPVEPLPQPPLQLRLLHSMPASSARPS